MADKLTNKQISERLGFFPEWDFDPENGRLFTTVELQDWDEAINFVNTVAGIATLLDHHPDILVYDYKFVEVFTTTHSVDDGITEADFQLMEKIDKILEGAEESNPESEKFPAEENGQPAAESAPEQPQTESLVPTVTPEPPINLAPATTVQPEVAPTPAPVEAPTIVPPIQVPEPPTPDLSIPPIAQEDPLPAAASPTLEPQPTSSPNPPV